MSNRLQKDCAQTQNMNEDANTKRDTTSNKRGRNNYNRSKSKKKDSRNTQTGFSGRKGNDPQWYLNSQMGIDVASFNFNMPNGYPIRFSNDSKLSDVFVPGIVTVKTVPTIGRATEPTDAINMAAINQFSYIRSHYSGDAPYESTDLLIYEVAIANVISALFYMKRAYGVCNLYSPMNKYLPQALMEAMGWSFAGTLGKMPEFHWYIENLVNRISQLACPGNMDIFKKYAFMYANLYIESETTIKDQMYMYVPQGFLVYNPTANEKGGMLEFKALPSTELDPQQMYLYVTEMIEPLIEDTGIRRMSADIMGVYGDNVLKFETFPTDYLIVPVYNKSVLEQFKNVEVFPLKSESVSVTQEHGEPGKANRSWLISKPTSWHTSYTQDQSWEFNSMITTDAPNASPELIMELTRFKYAAEFVYTGETISDLKLYTGTFIPMEARVWCFKRNEQGFIDLEYTSLQDYWHGYSGNNADWHQACIYAPMSYSFSTAGDGSMEVRPEFPISNYALLTGEEIKKLHETAILSLFTPHN